MPQGVFPDLPPANAPDLAGFKDAQARLNQAMGQLVTFLVPGVPVWPEGTMLDPETNTPYDPTVVPISGGEPGPVEIKVTVVYAPIGGTDDVIEGPSGVRHDERVSLLIQEADRPLIEDATTFALEDMTYRISEIVDDSSFNGRHIAFGEAQ